MSGKGDVLVATGLTDEQRRLVDENRGLVWMVVHRLPIPESRKDDAAQTGMLGLARAAQLYDPTKAKFSTYAPVWIRSYIQRGRRDEGGAEIPVGEDTFGYLPDGTDPSAEAEALADAEHLLRRLGRFARQDQLDRAILAELARVAAGDADIRGVCSRIARQVGLGPHSVRVRIRRLCDYARIEAA